jgi:putative transposase
VTGKAAWWAFEACLVGSLVEAGLSQRRALSVIGLSRGSWHQRHHPRAGHGEHVAHSQRRSPTWLTTAEVTSIRSLLTVAFSRGKSVYQAFFEALDAGTPVASRSSWHRIARAHLEASRPVRRRAARRASAMPQWDATAVMQVWSWDITKLKGPYVGTWYDFYVVIDVFSRKIVGWRIEQCESAELAEQMFQTAIADHGGQVPRIVHSDGGTSMVSKTLATFFRDLGIEVSKNRPRVSNDNPYSESWFKTAKYSPSAPAFFTNIDHARAWAGVFVPWYNAEHRHSSLEGHTPATVHDGTWIHIHHARQRAMDALVAAHPERYTRPVPLKTPHAHATLNHAPQPTDRLTTG